MPKPKYCVPKQKRDRVKGLILEQKAINNLTVEQIASIWNVSTVTCSKRLNSEHSDNWLGAAKELCKKLGVPIEDFREAVRY